MRARHAYPLLFLIPAAMVATIGAVLAAAAGAGVLWLFVYGDNPWPASANAVVMALASAAALVALAALLLVARRVGEIQESRGGVRRVHVLVALGLTLGLPVLVLLHQWQVGNLGGAQVPPNNSSKPTPLRGAA